MLSKTVKLLRGSVRVRAQSVYPERVLNLCSARGIEFWDLQWCGANVVRSERAPAAHL